MANKTQEEWKEFENNYFVSNTGKVKHKDYPVKKPYIDSDGYERIMYNGSNNKKKCRYVHRLVAEAFVSNPYNKSCVHHKDDNRLNNHYTNLEWVTNEENQRLSRGSEGKCKVINKDQQSELIEFYQMGFSTRELAKYYGIGHQSVSYYLKRDNVPVRRGRRSSQATEKLMKLVTSKEDGYPPILKTGRPRKDKKIINDKKGEGSKAHRQPD